MSIRAKTLRHVYKENGCGCGTHVDECDRCYCHCYPEYGVAIMGFQETVKHINFYCNDCYAHLENKNQNSEPYDSIVRQHMGQNIICKKCNTHINKVGEYKVNYFYEYRFVCNACAKEKNLTKKLLKRLKYNNKEFTCGSCTKTYFVDENYGAINCDGIEAYNKKEFDGGNIDFTQKIKYKKVETIDDDGFT